MSANKRGGPRPGAGHPPKLDEDQVAALLKLHSQGISQGRLAATFHVHKDTVRRYIRKAGL